MNDEELAKYIFAWLETRNRAALRDVLESMTIADRKLALEELALILLHKGRPPNWVA